MEKDQNIYLIGLMGVGKTTVGRQLAKCLNRPFYDTDHEIIERTGVSVSTIFEIEGEPGFRRREAQTLLELCDLNSIVMATGGGIVLDPENRKCLRDTGWVVYLNAPPRLLYERTRFDRSRPLLRVDNPLARLEELYKARDPLYRETAHYVLEASHFIASGIVHHLLREFKKRIAL